MAIKKFKPQSPDPAINKIKGDTEFARLAHLNKLIDEINKGGGSYTREILTFPVPAVNDVINITPTAIDTIVVFQGVLTDDFTINVSGSSSLPGNRMYIFLEGSGSPTVTFSGDITTTQCGGSDNQYSPNDPVCLEEIFNGNLFIGVDNC